MLKIDYLPTKLFDEDRRTSRRPGTPRRRTRREDRQAGKAGQVRRTKDSKEAKEGEGKKPQSAKEKRARTKSSRKMDKTSQVTLWVDPATHQIVKYTFDNVWLDFLPAGWLVRSTISRDRCRWASPFPAYGSPQSQHPRRRDARAGTDGVLRYTREFSNIARPTSSSKITVPKMMARELAAFALTVATAAAVPPLRRRESSPRSVSTATPP